MTTDRIQENPPGVTGGFSVWLNEQIYRLIFENSSRLSLTHLLGN